MPITPEQIQALLDAEKKATPGPYVASGCVNAIYCDADQLLFALTGKYDMEFAQFSGKTPEQRLANKEFLTLAANLAGDLAREVRDQIPKLFDIVATDNEVMKRSNAAIMKLEQENARLRGLLIEAQNALTDAREDIDSEMCSKDRHSGPCIDATEVVNKLRAALEGGKSE